MLLYASAPFHCPLSTANASMLDHAGKRKLIFPKGPAPDPSKLQRDSADFPFSPFSHFTSERRVPQCVLRRRRLPHAEVHHKPQTGTCLVQLGAGDWSYAFLKSSLEAGIQHIK
eukprot:381615-Pyramimonas_sp.AAC.1